MTPPNQTVGRRGERLAEEYLLALGATLLERNFRRDYTEIDLLVEYEGELVAVEVKTRDVEDLEQPEEAVRWAQLRRITRGMTTYAMNNDRLEMPWRIDAILI